MAGKRYFCKCPAGGWYYLAFGSYYMFIIIQEKTKYNRIFRRRKMKITSLDEALERIDDLEKKINDLKAENEQLRNRNLGGRKKHDESWKASYNDFVLKYSSGMTIMEIVNEGMISRRTAYRYLEYYRSVNGTG